MISSHKDYDLIKYLSGFTSVEELQSVHRDIVLVDEYGTYFTYFNSIRINFYINEEGVVDFKYFGGMLSDRLLWLNGIVYNTHGGVMKYIGISKFKPINKFNLSTHSIYCYDGYVIYSTHFICEGAYVINGKVYYESIIDSSILISNELYSGVDIKEFKYVYVLYDKTVINKVTHDVYELADNTNLDIITEMDIKCSQNIVFNTSLYDGSILFSNQDGVLLLRNGEVNYIERLKYRDILGRYQLHNPDKGLYYLIDKELKVIKRLSSLPYYEWYYTGDFHRDILKPLFKPTRETEEYLIGEYDLMLDRMNKVIVVKEPNLERVSKINIEDNTLEFFVDNNVNILKSCTHIENLQSIKVFGSMLISILGNRVEVKLHGKVYNIKF